MGGLLLAPALVLTSCHDQRLKGADPSPFSEKELTHWVTTIAPREGSVFVTPDLLPIAVTAGLHSLPSPSESLAAVTSSSDFWRLHRSHGFRLALIGGTAPSRPLALRLHSSPLWVLADVSPWGYTFVPVSPPSGSKHWQFPSSGDLVSRFPEPGMRSAWIAGTASNLIAIGLLREASDLLGSRTDNEPPTILEARASLAAAKGHWNDAETLARASLSGDSRRSASRIILVRALTETGRTTDALAEAGQLVRLRQDQESLFLLARAANAAGDREGEIEALEKLVLLGRRDHQPLGASLTYLGQAYGRAGRRGDAMRALEEALRSPELDDSQKEAVRQLLEHLKPDAPATDG